MEYLATEENGPFVLLKTSLFPDRIHEVLDRHNPSLTLNRHFLVRSRGVFLKEDLHFEIGGLPSKQSSMTTSRSRFERWLKGEDLLMRFDRRAACLTLL
jgi:hypothetical protein